MKILNILSEAYTDTIYAYHATKPQFLRSILKQGLIPNKNDVGYGSTEVSGSFGYSLKSLPGIYFTADYTRAEHIGKMYGDSPIIIIAKISKSTIEMDEDNIASSIVDERNLIKDIRQNEKNILKNPDAYISKKLNDILKLPEMQKLNPKVIENVKNDLYGYLKTLIMSQASDDDMGSNEFNQKIRQYQETITKKLRHISQNDDSGYLSFKVQNPVTFSGKNRIVGIYNLLSYVGWGDLGEFERDAYHKVKSPIELIKN